MKILDVQIDGFGKLRERTFAFDPLLTVVFGPNEAGKSTLAAAIAATLYGTGRKRDAYRPWDGGRYGALIRYRLESGREYEVSREFDDGRTIRVRNRDGEDVTSDVVNGKSMSPGLVHLGVPFEVFVNASCVRQGEVEIEAARADAIGAALARALDGGPKEDAAIGALNRLERAIAEHVGAKRATVKVPLRRLQERAASAEGAAETARQRVRDQDELRRKAEEQRARCAVLANQTRAHERSARSARAAVLRSRIASLRTIRDDIAAMQAQRAAYDDVADFPKERVAELEQRFVVRREREAVAAQAAEEAATARMSGPQSDELERRMQDGGALDDAAFAALQDAARTVQATRDAAHRAAEGAAAARRAQPDDGTLTGAALSASVLLFAGAIVLAIVHFWIPATEFAAPAAAFVAFVIWRMRRRRLSAARVRAAQSTSDAATAREREAAQTLAASLQRFAVTSFDELAERRRRAHELQARANAAAAAAQRAVRARAAADASAQAFGELAQALVPGERGADEDVAAARRCAARRTTRDGIDAQLGMLRVARDNALGSDDEVALERELQELIDAGAVPDGVADGTSARRLENEHADFVRRLHAAEREETELTADLRAAEAQSVDLAALDEEVATLREQITTLQRFKRAVDMAHDTIEERMREAHEKFARRLADYATDTFARVTAGRYVDLRVAPATLAITLRAPETGRIHDLDDVSMGTREQAYLVLRLAMARMFAEGSEVLPLLLDDPFVSWDAERIARGLPVLHAATRDSQVVIFTASAALAEAAAASGAARIDLAPDPATASA